MAATPTPPPELVRLYSGSDDAEHFHRTGREFLGHFVNHGGLRPDDRVLDLGCGCGRMALALLPFLSPRGSYEGIDIHPPSIAWASDHVTAFNPRFRFRAADVRNTTYNPTGRVPAWRYRLPFDDGAFDFVFLTSVFTHLLTHGMRNYLEEIARVLKPGGRCFITYFLLDSAAETGIRAGKSTFQFPYRRGRCRIENPNSPEAAVAYPVDYVERLYRATGLALAGPVRFGGWSGRPDPVSYQDIVVASKVGGLSWSSKLRRTVLGQAA